MKEQKIIKGDLLKSNCNIICHQVNIQGIMGGGIALSIAKMYPECEKQYVEFVEKHKDNLEGRVFFYKIDDNHYIANCFSQSEDFDTIYPWVLKCAFKVNEWAKKRNLETVGIPYGYGCGIANGNWNIVSNIWDNMIRNANLIKYLYTGDLVEITNENGDKANVIAIVHKDGNKMNNCIDNLMYFEDPCLILRRKEAQWQKDS